MRFNTSLLHGEESESDPAGATLPPVYQVSAFAHGSAEELERVFGSRAPGFTYTRVSNPTTAAFERRMARAEGGAAAVACSSGLAAVAMALLNVVQSGGEILSGSSLFGGTLDLLGDLKALGIRTRFLPEMTPAAVEENVTPATRAVFAELIGNPRLDVIDVRGVAAAAERHGVPLIVDSTTATPALIRPLEHGAHVVVHSSSKYINGSGDAISGVIVDGGRFRWDFEKYPMLARYRAFGSLAYTARLRQDLCRNFGTCLSPQNAYLNCVGLETLGIRMERLCANALALADNLRTFPALSDVNYPGLPDSPYRALIESQMNGGMGGAILTVRAGSKRRAFSLMDHLKYALIATNIGDVRTLVIHPASTIYAQSDPRQRRSAGISDDLIRVSVGLEDIEDLKEDFAQAIRNMERDDIQKEGAS